MGEGVTAALSAGQLVPTVPWFFWLWALASAAALGSFANVVIYRLPRMWLFDWIEHTQLEPALPPNVDRMHLNLAWPHSFCPSCGQALRWWHNIPVLGFVLLGGRCGHCGHGIAWRYFWVELGVVCVAWVSLLMYGWQLLALWVFVLLYVLWVAAWVDGLHGVLLDVFTWGLLLLGLGMRLSVAPDGLVHDAAPLSGMQPNAFWRVYGPSDWRQMGTVIVSGLWAGGVGFLLLWLPRWVYWQIRKVEGLGLGDCKLLAALGVWLGVLSLPDVLLYACLTALLWVLIGGWLHVGWLALCRGLRVGQVHGDALDVNKFPAWSDRAQVKIPLGPFLALGALIKLGVVAWM